MKSSITKIIATLLFTPVLVFASVASAQVNTTSFAAPNSNTDICTTLSHSLYIGSRDAWTGGEVTMLQNFLYTNGNLQVSASGYFGILTQRAVRQFQASAGISATGYVGPLTRTAIQNLSCGTTNSGFYIQSLIPSSGAIGTQVTIYGAGFTGDNTILFGSGAIVHVSSSNGSSLTFTVPSALNPLCYYSGCMMPSRETTPGTYNVSVQNARGTTNTISFAVTSGVQNTPVTIYSITPISGAVGTNVSITGFGFTNANTVHIGGGAIGNVPISSSIAIACTTSPTCHGGINQTLTITTPSSIGPYCASGLMCPMYMQLLTPGVYTIYVQNDNGTSNSVSFTITGTSSNQAPMITGLDAPATLALGSSGTWTVHASAIAGSTTSLHYSVSWGDQQPYAMNGIVASPTSSSQSSATFTHAYSQAGTYTATFTVSYDSNNSSTVSSTITVTPLY